MSILVGLLVLVNLGLVFWLLKPPPKPGNEAQAEAIMQRVFQFDDEQMELARSSRNRHKANLAEHMDELDKLSIAYYIDTNSLAKAALLDQLLEATQAIYAINDRHFEEIRQICNEDQQDRVRGLIRSLVLREKQ